MAWWLFPLVEDYLLLPGMVLAMLKIALEKLDGSVPDLGGVVEGIRTDPHSPGNWDPARYSPTSNPLRDHNANSTEEPLNHSKGSPADQNPFTHSGARCEGSTLEARTSKRNMRAFYFTTKDTQDKKKNTLLVLFRRACVSRARSKKVVSACRARPSRRGLG